MSTVVTMDDIAARAGVSRGAVSLALRASPKISAKTRELVLQVAKELGYRPNVNASRLARTDFSTFGLVASDLHNPITADLLDGFVLSDTADDHETYLGTGFNTPERERKAIESFLAHRVKGLVLLGSLLPDPELQELARSIPTVLVGRRIAEIDCVLVNDATGGALVAHHLLGRGHSHLAHIDGGTGAGATRRKEAFLVAVQSKTGTKVDVVSGNYTQESGYKGASVLFAQAQPPTAIFAANDLMALGVLGAARQFGLMAGADFALVGFDDITIAAYDFVSLTTVSYSRPDMGRIGRELLLQRCAELGRPPQTIELEPTLVVRKSSGAA